LVSKKPWSRSTAPLTSDCVVAELPIDVQLAASRRELLGRWAVMGVDAGLPVPDQRFRERAELPEAAGESPRTPPAAPSRRRARRCRAQS
jgi:hypothetical protein